MAARGARGVSDLLQQSLRSAVPIHRSFYSLSVRYQSSTPGQTSPTGPYTKKRETKEGEAGPSDPKRLRVIPNPLGRPLGVTLKPVSSLKTYVKESESFFDAERRKAERKVLLKEASRGYFHDYNRARQGEGGKAWLAPNVLIREDKALYFPNIGGTTLLSEKTCTTDLFKGKTSLVSILTTRLSEEHAQSFVKPVLKDQEKTPNFNYIQINHQSNVLKATLISLVKSSIRRTVPEQLWSTYMISRGEWSEIDINEPLGIENKILGYVFLVDHNCKVRWAGCGLAREEEVTGLRAATEVLIRRAAEGKA